MKFSKKVQTKYQQEVVAYTPNFAETFELTSEIASFMTQYSLWDDVEAATTAKIMTDKERAQRNVQENKPANKGKPSAPAPIPTQKTKEFMKFPLGTDLKLKADVQKELTRTFNLFHSRSYASKRFKETEAALTESLNNLIKKVATSLKVQPRGIKVKVEINEPDSYTADLAYYGTAEVSYKGDSVDLEPYGLYYTFDVSAQIGDAASSFDWVAWMGIDESPFYNERFVDDYLYDQASSWFSEAGSIEGDEQMIEKKIKDLLLEHENGNQEAAKEHYMGQRKRHEQWKKTQERRHNQG